jgi:hypothetical protein
MKWWKEQDENDQLLTKLTTKKLVGSFYSQ